MQQMENGVWLSPLILGAGQFYLWQETNPAERETLLSRTHSEGGRAFCGPPRPGRKGDIVMPVNVNAIIRRLNPAERKKVEDRAAEIIAEEMSLCDLRKARKLTQARVAKRLGITQDSVSRLEKRSDLLISTLRKTVRAMGGDVRIVAEFPDGAPIVLSGMSEHEPARKPRRRRGL